MNVIINKPDTELNNHLSTQKALADLSVA